MCEKNITKEDCANLLTTCLKTDKFKLIDISTQNSKNQNVELKILAQHDGKEETFRFLVTPGSNPSLINQIISCNFKKIIPNFNGEIAPKFYQTAKFGFFEDIGFQGFQRSRIELFDLKHIKIVLEVLAKFHGASFVYEEIKSKIGRTQFRLKDEFEVKQSNVDLRKARKLISSLLEDNSDENVSKVVRNLQERLSSTKFRRTLCHNSLVVNNIMFKYENKKPVDCRLVNFGHQYAPPICDVLQVILFNSDEESHHHFHVLLKYYYDCLDNELDKYDLYISNILPSDDWQIQAHHFLPLVKLEGALSNNTLCLKELKEDLNCAVLSRQDVYEVVSNKLKVTNYDLKTFEVKHPDSVSGFLGAYHKLQIRVGLNNEESVINCFVKCMPTTTASKEVVQDSNGFCKEAFVYQTLIPKYQKMGIGIVDDCSPACYFHRPKDLMIFEDLGFFNYETVSSRNPFDFETLSLVIKKLAKFHASAFIYEEKMSEKLGRQYRTNEEYMEFFKEAIVVDDQNHSGGKLMATGLNAILPSIDLFPELQTSQNVANLAKYWPKMKNLFYSTLTASDRFRNVVSHGDLWSSNILIKFNDSKAIDCRFVDYQLLRYCPPGHDFLSVLHLTTNRTTRLKYEEELRRVYYKELSFYLDLYGYDVAGILPYEDFTGGIDLMRCEMLIQTAIYSMFCMCSEDQISSMLSSEEESQRVFFEDRKDFIERMCKISEVYKTTLKERILDIYEYCNSTQIKSL